MTVRFADSYVDRLFAERDIDLLHHLISVVETDRALPEEFWLFCRMIEWAPARSGAWQYYDGLPDETFDRMSNALERFGLTEIAEKYRLGKKTWDEPDHAASLDTWLDANAKQIQDAVFRLIEPKKNCLKDQR